MNTALCFWCVTILLLVCASFFMLPPLWISSDTVSYSVRTRATYAVLLVFLLVLASIFIYNQVGNIGKITNYYSGPNQAQSQSSKLIRPLYADLQRSLVKYELSLPIDIKDIDLILNFAQAQSQSQAGVLPNDVQKLLLAVLNAVPKQITALNLLAVHAYKTDSYANAIKYWEDILAQFTPELRNTAVERALQDKITQTRAKITKQSQKLT